MGIAVKCHIFKQQGDINFNINYANRYKTIVDKDLVSELLKSLEEYHKTKLAAVRRSDNVHELSNN